MQLNFGAREATIKLVYYGPALSGKTTNLKTLHRMTRAESRGRLMTLETRDDRTLFFDLLPFVVRPSAPGVFNATGGATGKGATGRGMSLRVKVFTVPGQVLHASTRRLVLQGADGVAFIADSQASQTENNAASFLDLRDNMQMLGLSLRDMPLVIQFNKRDMPNVRSDDEIGELARRGREPVFRASALAGEGVLETFVGLVHVTWQKLDREHQIAKMVGIDGHAFVPDAARQIGFDGDIADLLHADLGKKIVLDRPTPSPSPSQGTVPSAKPSAKDDEGGA